MRSLVQKIYGSKKAGHVAVEHRHLLTSLELSLSSRWSDAVSALK